MPDQVGHDDIGKVVHDGKGVTRLNYVGVSDEGLT